MKILNKEEQNLEQDALELWNHVWKKYGAKSLNILRDAVLLAREREEDRAVRAMVFATLSGQPSGILVEPPSGGAKAHKGSVLRDSKKRRSAAQ